MNFIRFKGHETYINLDNVQKIVYDKPSGRITLDFNNENDLSNIFFEGQDARDLVRYLDEKTTLFERGQKVATHATGIELNPDA